MFGEFGVDLEVSEGEDGEDEAELRNADASVGENADVVEWVDD